MSLVVLSCVTARAQDVDLQGRWKLTIPANPSYVGVAFVDASGRTFLDDDHGGAWRGYIKRIDRLNVEFVTTAAGAVSHVFCVIQSNDLLHCRGGFYADGRPIANSSILSRVGPAPANLAAPR